MTKEKLEIRFGVDSIRKWSQVDAQNPETRITASLAWATAYVEGALEGYAYLITNAIVDATIIDIAGYRLYTVRGIDGDDAAKNELQSVWALAKEVLNDIRNGRLKVGKTYASTSTPTVYPSD